MAQIQRFEADCGVLPVGRLPDVLLLAPSRRGFRSMLPSLVFLAKTRVSRTAAIQKMISATRRPVNPVGSMKPWVPTVQHSECATIFVSTGITLPPLRQLWGGTRRFLCKTKVAPWLGKSAVGVMLTLRRCPCPSALRFLGSCRNVRSKEG